MNSNFTNSINRNQLANAIEWLPGTWHVQASNFPLWLKGDKRAPTFTYTPVSPTRLLDTVAYQRVKDGAARQIVGYDDVTADGSAFVWRGKGWLWIARSRWRVLDVSEDGQQAVIAFERTLFTPAGVDVISRSATADEAIKTYAARVLITNGIAADSLRWLR